MDIRKLQYFLAVAEEGQITKAAKRLHMAQPPLSQQLKLLESELGIQLFDRSSSRKLKLTDAGQVLRTRAEQILALVDQTVKELKDRPEIWQQTLSIGISSVWDAAFIPDKIRSFREQYPDAKIQIQGCEADKVGELFNQESIDLAITRVPADLKKFAAIVLADEPFVAVFPTTPGDIISSRYVRLPELADKPLIVHRQHEQLLEYYRQIALEPKIRCRHSDLRSMIAWASAGIGVAIVPKSVVSMLPDNTLRIKEIIEPDLRTTKTAVIWRRDRNLSVMSMHFIDMLKNQANCKLM